MITFGIIIVLVIFAGVGWAVSTEMFQHRAWRRRVESGDLDIVASLIEEALAGWRKGRPPKNVPASLWAGVQGVQLVAVDDDGVTVSASAEPEFRTEAGTRVQVTSALDEAIALAARVLDMMLYDVPNLRLGYVRVDVYSTFSAPGGAPVQRPILTATARRAVADALEWEALTSAEVLGRFDSAYVRGAGGQAVAIELPPVAGDPPRPTPEAAAEFESSRQRARE